MADLGVAHLPVGKPDVAPAGRQRRVRVALPELVEDRASGERDRVAGPGLGQPPAVEDDQAATGPARDQPPPRRSSAASLRLARQLADREEVAGVERGAADEAAVDVRARRTARRRCRASPSRRRGSAPRRAASASRAATSPRMKRDRLLAPGRGSRCARCRSPRSARRRSPAVRGARPRRRRGRPRAGGASTASVSPASRSASVSPTQRIGSSPASSSAGTLRASASSVSPKSWRRSEWPTIAPATPSSASIGIETSPGERARFGLVHVLGGDRDRRAPGAVDGRRQRGERRAATAIVDRLEAAQLADEALEEVGGLGRRLVHLPVRRHERPAARVRHRAAPPPRAAPCPPSAPATRRRRSRASRPRRRARTPPAPRPSRRRRPR